MHAREHELGAFASRVVSEAQGRDLLSALDLDLNEAFAGPSQIVERPDRPHPVGQELQTRIFTPLGLRDTYFPYADPHLRTPYAHGYLLNQPGAPGPVDTTVMSPSWAGAAGGIVSTAADLAHFSTALFTGKLLPAAQLQEMMTTIPIPEPWAAVVVMPLYAYDKNTAHIDEAPLDSAHIS